MGGIPLGDGVVGIPAIVKALKQSGFDGATTLEIFGTNNVKISAQRLASWWGNSIRVARQGWKQS
ncbi:MAG: hypothetical protein WCS94_01670 [Verrucomicrobiota bacterium]